MRKKTGPKARPVSLPRRTEVKVVKEGSGRKGNQPEPYDKDRSRAYLRIAESIRLRILSGDLQLGERLPNENDLARDEGAGRTTVREALRLLASVGLIETKRGARGGAFVTHPNADDLGNLVTTALSLMTKNGELADEAIAEAIAFTMPMVARIASLRATDEEVDMLSRLAASLPDAKTDVEWVNIAREFSTLVIHMSRNRVLAMILKPLMWIAPTLYRERRNTPGWRAATAVRYRELADAIRRRAPASAEEATLWLRQQYVPRRDADTGQDWDTQSRKK